jgi:hypothetical protein
MFTGEQRERLRAALIEHAASDTRIMGVALTGSGAAGGEDAWSDIDLAFGVEDERELANVLTDLTAHMYDQHGALHHVDVRSGPWIYRVFLLYSTLQVDLAFVTAGEFRALAPSFRLVHGRANEPRPVAPPRAADIIGMAWLYALHARSSIGRQKLWQAEYMVSGMRDQALALACLRHGLAAVHGRGLDQLPDEVAGRFEGALVRQLDAAELSRAFQEVTGAFLAEVRVVDASLAERLQDTLMQLTVRS